MHENFLALESEKRDRIINAAMREFSAKGYKNASTNEIVKSAGISKGALFHYFASKRELFEFLYRYAVDFMMDAMDPRIHGMPADVFERWIALAKFKIEVAAQHPDLADFMQQAFSDEAPEAVDLLKEEFTRFSVEFSQKVYEGIDFSKFKPEVDAQKALQIIWWTLEGYSLAKRKASPELKNIKSAEAVQPLIDEIAGYLDMLKKSFYKEEYLK